MSIANNVENKIMLLIFNGTAWADFADNDATSPATLLGLNLATADPADAGTMSTSEATYTGYARLNTNRATGAGGWTVAAAVATLTTTTAFGACTAGSNTITHFAVGYTGGGAVDILVSGTVTPNLSVSNGITPQLTSATTCTLD